MLTPSLALAHIAANQNQPEVTANDAFDGFDAAQNAQVSFANADSTLSLSQANMASGMVFLITGALTGDRDVQVPAIARFFVAKNNTTGGHNITVKTASGSGIAIAAADGYVILYCDATNVVAIGTAAAVPGGLNFADAEVPSGTIDGVNNTFTLAHTPSPSGSLILIRNGAAQRAGGSDFTLTTNSIAYAGAPASGDTHQAWYRY